MPLQSANVGGGCLRNPMRELRLVEKFARQIPPHSRLSRSYASDASDSPAKVSQAQQVQNFLRTECIMDIDLPVNSAAQEVALAGEAGVSYSGLIVLKLFLGFQYTLEVVSLTKIQRKRTSPQLGDVTTSSSLENFLAWLGRDNHLGRRAG